MNNEKDKTYCGFITIVGRPNVGKSTLLNHILGEKVSITANKPQTTRHRIMGVKTQADRQAIYVDTPGMHSRNDTALNKQLNKTASLAMQDVDWIGFLVEAGVWTAEEERILNRLTQSATPILLIINKVDKIKDKTALLPFVERIARLHTFAEVFLLSARTGEQVSHFSDWVLAHLPVGTHYFPPDQLTDRHRQFMICELIREQLTRRLGDELPYGLTVTLEHVEKKKSCWHYHATIWVTKENHKQMIIGHLGQALKTIGMQARKQIEGLLGEKIFLGLWIKVKENWVDDVGQLKILGINDD